VKASRNSVKIQNCTPQLVLLYKSFFPYSNIRIITIKYNLISFIVIFWPLVPKFTGSNPAEAFGFLRAKRSSARHPSEGK